MIESSWRSCNKCGSLFSETGSSVCAAGDRHDEGGSLHYVLTDNTFVQGSGAGNMWGVLGVSGTGPGVRGQSDSTGVVGEGNEYGVHGKSNGRRGVYGENTADGDGVAGSSQFGTGVFGEGERNGVHGKSSAGRAVYGENTADGDGVGGFSATGTGVAGVSNTGRGVYAHSESNDGVGGFSESGTGVAGISKAGVGVYARSKSGRAGYFEGNVWMHGDLEVTGDIRLTGADCAEEFSVPIDVATGTVMVIDDAGVLAVSSRAYDKRVAGVIAGAGSYRPALILDGEAEAPRSYARKPVSLMGKAYCRVEANQVPISVGDLVTTSAVPGFAMRATDRDRAFGAVLGKALAPLGAGTAMIPILVTLQ